MTRRVFVNLSLVAIGVGIGVALGPLSALTTSAQGGCQTFVETGKQVCGRFLEYWKANGGLAQQGLPISNEFTEVSDLNGQSYTVQYFERAVFEKHPENATPYDVLLSQLGTFQYARKYPNGDPGGNTPVPPAGGGIVGQTLTSPDLGKSTTFNIVVTDAKESIVIPAQGIWRESRAQGKFVAVIFNATNVGKEPGAPSSFYLRLKDNQGRTFDTTGDINAAVGGADYYGGKSVGTVVQPGLTTKIVFVFDVAPDAAGYMLVSR